MIVGASSGIGTAIALRSKEEKVLTSRNIKKLSHLKGKKVECDVTKEGDIARLFKPKTMYDSVIYCAGFAKPDAVSVLDTMDMDQADRKSVV